MTNRSLQNLSPHFVIPAGTQVVLKSEKQLEDGTFRKPGVVGVVIKCPPHNQEPYLVEFTDGHQVLASFAELTLRRQEIDSLLEKENEDLKSFVIYQCRVGSRAFGLATKNSDDDLRGIFMPPAERHWSLYRLPEQVEINRDGNDEVYWELEKFVRLALKANPNILETLWTPEVTLQTPLSENLRSIRKAFLSRHVFKTYSGYVLSQFRRMKNAHDKTGKYKTKHAMHLLRLQYSGIVALETGEIMIDVSGQREQLMRVRQGELSFQEVSDMAMNLESRLQQAFDRTTLPEQPDLDVVNHFLVNARKSALDFWSTPSE